jgi:hypothetical protein
MISRDAGVRRTATITGGLVAAAVAGTVGFATLAHASDAGTRQSTTSTDSSTDGSNGTSNGDSGGWFNPGSSGVTRGHGGAHASSGGS